MLWDVAGNLGPLSTRAVLPSQGFPLRVLGFSFQPLGKLQQVWLGCTISYSTPLSSSPPVSLHLLAIKIAIKAEICSSFLHG